MNRSRDRNASPSPPQPKTIVILAAGLSTRYGSLKQLDAVGPHGATLLDYSVFDALRAGFTRVVVVVRREIEAAMHAHTARWLDCGVELGLALQSLEHPVLSAGVERRKPWGTAHAVLTAARHLSGAFAVCNADDFYGREAFVSLANHLWHGGTHDTSSALVGYRLADTLSDFGGVSRALCACDAHGFLRRIVELKNVSAGARGIRGDSGTDGTLLLSGDEVVSTNFWGLSPAIVQNLDSQFGTFLERRGRDRESEFLLSTAINEQLALEAVRVRVLPTHAPFLGITFPDDKRAVAQRIAQMIAEGHYPADLWAERP